LFWGKGAKARVQLFTARTFYGANILSEQVFYTLLYVVPFYLSARTRPSATLSRDAPSVIRARIASVTLTCALCSAATFYVLTSPGHASSQDAAHLMGYWPVGLVAAGSVLLLTALLFAGPLFEQLVVHSGWRACVKLEPVKELLGDWITWRNIVAVSIHPLLPFLTPPASEMSCVSNNESQGPVTEEVLFRSAAVPLMLLARTSLAKTIFLSPVIFGLAHVHHFYEFRITHRQVPLVAAVARSIFQLAFTSVFGAYATFLFLRTGSLLAICLVHSFCNSVGLPRVWGRVAPEVDGDGAEDGKGKRSSVLWTFCYYVFLVAGAVGWYWNLWSLTLSPSALVPEDKW